MTISHVVPLPSLFSVSRTRAACSALLLSGLLAAVGCESSDDDAQREAHDAAEPLYVVSTQVLISDSQNQGYLASVSSLDGGRFDVKNAIEVSSGMVQADRENGYLYHASSRDPIITRYKLEDDGSFSEDGTLDFSNLGLDSVGAAAEAPFFAPDKAYFVRNQELIIWNPKDLEIIGSVPIEVENDGMLLRWMTLVQRADRLFVTVHWQRDFSEDYTIFGDHVDLIEIDPETDAEVARTSDYRCNQLDTATSTSDGTLYLSSNAYNSPMRAMFGDDHGVDSCALRIVPKGESYDAGYEVDLPSLVGGRQAGDFGIVDDETAVLRVWHPELVSELADDKSNWEDIMAESGHLWWRWNIGDDAATPIEDQEPGAFGGEWFRVDGHLLLLTAEGDFSASTLLELQGDELVPALSGPGYVFGVTRVR
jgi:hypothetical protein